MGYWVVYLSICGRSAISNIAGARNGGGPMAKSKAPCPGPRPHHLRHDHEHPPAACIQQRWAGALGLAQRDSVQDSSASRVEHAKAGVGGHKGVAGLVV